MAADTRVRAAIAEDATALRDLKVTLEEETTFMLVAPGEREETVDELAVHLTTVSSQLNSVVLLADIEGRLVGYVEARGVVTSATATRRTSSPGSSGRPGAVELAEVCSTR